MVLAIRILGKPTRKCSVCHGEGYVYQRDGSLRVCRVCSGAGKVEVLRLAEEALARFNQPKVYKVREGSVVLVYQGLLYDEAYTALQVLTVSGIRAQIELNI